MYHIEPSTTKDANGQPLFHHVIETNMKGERTFVATMGNRYHAIVLVDAMSRKPGTDNDNIIKFDDNHITLQDCRIASVTTDTPDRTRQFRMQYRCLSLKEAAAFAYVIVGLTTEDDADFDQHARIAVLSRLHDIAEHGTPVPF